MRQSRRSSKLDSQPHHEPGSEGGILGSPEPEFLIVGRITRPHGIRGEVAMRNMTDYPERLLEVETLYVGPEHRPYRVKRMRRHADGMLIAFEGVGDRNLAAVLREQFVYIHISDAVPLEEGEYYLFQIEGIRVVTEDGRQLGRLTGLIETGANDVYIITSDEGKEVLIPAIPEVIQDVDVPGRVMTVKLLEGLV